MSDQDKVNEKKLVEQLRFGNCYPTAMVLNEALGWPIGALIVDVRARSWLPHVVHAYVVAPDGSLFDAGGFTCEQSILDTYLPKHRHERSREPRFIDFGDSDSFRRKLRRFYVGAAEDESHRYFDPDFDEEKRTDYDTDLDERLPWFRTAVIERLQLLERAAEGCDGHGRGRVFA